MSGHHHGHSHAHAPADFSRAFAIGIFLNLAFVLIEFFYGRISHSLALVADAGHNLSDVLSLALAWMAAVLAKRQPTANRTYGMRRSTILAALVNAVVLLIALGAIAWESIQRFSNPSPIEGQMVMWVAGAGILVNAVTAMLFFSGRHHDVNVSGAFMHMAADAIVSAGVVIGAFVILSTGWVWLDPMISLAIVALILAGTWGLLRDSLNLALDAVPKGIDPAAIQEYLGTLPKVVAVHDLHVWGMSTTETALTAHLVMTEPVCDNGFLIQVENELHKRFGIEHATMQLETADGVSNCKCSLADLPVARG